MGKGICVFVREAQAHLETPAYLCLRILGWSWVMWPPLAGRKSGIQEPGLSRLPQSCATGFIPWEGCCTPSQNWVDKEGMG